MAYDREKKRWTRDVPLGRSDKGLSRGLFQREKKPKGGNFGSTLKRAKREAGKRLNKVGKKGRANARALAVFKKECVRLGIDRCEVRGPHCTGTEDLTWAHGRKRRELLEGELETFAIVACQNCHRPLDEELTHAEMAVEVGRIHALRPERYLEAA